MKIALIQKNYTVGDLEGNAQKIVAASHTAANQAVDLIVTSELSLVGYPPKDLLLNSSFIWRAQRVLVDLAEKLKETPPVIVGTALSNPSSIGKPLFNAAVLLSNGKITHQWHKILIPSYDVFDEERYFESGKENNPLTLNGKTIGVSICEDMWNDDMFWQRRRYSTDPIEKLARRGSGVIINISASPFAIGKQTLRESMLCATAKKYTVPTVYVNQVGGNDDLVFDGRSCVIAKDGRLIARANAFEEDVLIVDLNSTKNRISPDDFTAESEAYRALVLGTRDYVEKTGFQKGIIGLSGGVDSSLTAAVVSAALGNENVLGVLMPSPYTSTESISDAQTVAKNLGIKTMTVPINGMMDAYHQALAEIFKEYPQDVTEENIQARIRGNILMALSNKLGAMVLSTGNKSEMAVGYCTLYGDMSGGLAVLADVPKTLVYKLAKYLNKQKEVIPQSVIAKAPSAELRLKQTDQDTLPPYDVLDTILARLIEEYASIDELIHEGFDRSMVKRVYQLVEAAEFKRKQSAPGIKITDRAFGTGWRMPIAKKHDETKETTSILA